MTNPSPALNGQIEDLRRTAAQLIEDGHSERALALLLELLTRLAADNERLQLRLGALLRDKFGRKTEKISPAQLKLFLDQLPDPIPPPEKPDASPTEPPLLPQPRRPRLKPKRKPLPAALPRVTVDLPLPEKEQTCPHCQAERAIIRHEESEVLDYQPATFRIIVYRRAVGVCPQCEQGVAVAPVPPKPVEKGIPSFGLMTDVLLKKFAGHLPLHRIRTIYRRHGPEIPVSTLADWVEAGAEALVPLAREIRRRVLAAFVLQVDDTPLTVLDRERPGGSKRGHIWAFVGDRCWVAYAYTPTWEAKGPGGFLAGRTGYVQADAAGALDPFFRTHAGQAVEVGFRVGGDVAVPTPHRSGRAHFAHPVPHEPVSLATV